MAKLDLPKIEKKWQNRWAKAHLYEANPDVKKPKFYVMVEFPYPSGDGLHVGHVRSYTAMDIVARKRRMEGYNVLFPIGWDAFGLPTENYAIKMGIHPSVVTKQNTAKFKRQLLSLGFSFDWSREINTTDPKYYKWTQWIFLQFYKKGLAYKKKMPINWCPSCKIGLANEEVVAGNCERCGHKTEKREKEQWMLAITKYADRLRADLDSVDYVEKIKIQQKNWIGKKEGINIAYHIEGSSEKITVFTTRPDTNFGATFIALAPEHELAAKIIVKSQKNEFENYLEKVRETTDAERISEGRKKTGVFTGRYATNPLNGYKMPIWVSDFVLGHVGTGAVVGVPGHDIRDYEFAIRFSLPVIKVIESKNILSQKSKVKSQKYNAKFKNSDGVEVYEGEGRLVNSNQFNGMSSKKGRAEIIKWFEEKGYGEKVTIYNLRDWIFSRQHYWGEPIPLIFCENCKKLTESQKSKVKNQKLFTEGELLNPGWIVVPEKDLPVKLPQIERYQPTDTGESPLAAISEWVNTLCPTCGGKARRETDTMPNWAGSSWYYLAYLMRGISNFHISSQEMAKRLPISKYKEVFQYWMPVDWYNGGMEHTTLHLLYSRFWNKFLYDIGAVPVSEPYKKRTSHGMILGEGGVKMSKSRGNVVNPDDVVSAYGADTLRVYEMFLAPFDEATSWDSRSIEGSYRFLQRVWRVVVKKKYSAVDSQATKIRIHELIIKLREDIEAMKFNTAISACMKFVNFALHEKEASKETFKTFTKLLAPFAPHLAEELWLKLGYKQSVHLEAYPIADKAIARRETATIIVQINGKVRGKINGGAGLKEDEVKTLSLQDEKVSPWLKGKKLKKTIYIQDKLINFVL